MDLQTHHLHSSLSNDDVQDLQGWGPPAERWSLTSPSTKPDQRHKWTQSSTGLHQDEQIAEGEKVSRMQITSYFATTRWRRESETPWKPSWVWLLKHTAVFQIYVQTLIGNKDIRRNDCFSFIISRLQIPTGLFYLPDAERVCQCQPVCSWSPESAEWLRIMKLQKCTQGK